MYSITDRIRARIAWHQGMAAQESHVTGDTFHTLALAASAFDHEATARGLQEALDIILASPQAIVIEQGRGAEDVYSTFPAQVVIMNKEGGDDAHVSYPATLLTPAAALEHLAIHPEWDSAHRQLPRALQGMIPARDPDNVTRVTQDGVTVEIEYIGEGYTNDYQPDDPGDQPLLRFVVYHGGKDTGWCTNIPATINSVDAERLANHILASVLAGLREGLEASTIAKRFEGFTFEQIPVEAPTAA